jgi:3'(2'), 5'-bisphosphate nucleotidase
MEWDTAAGQAVVEGAGGIVRNAQNQKELRYDNPHVLNARFIAVAPK